MSTYYEYQDVGVMIAHKLMAMDGWEVFGYHADESDSMTDYYSPAYWNGVATKNGYILCVNVYGAAEPQEIRQYNYDGVSYDMSIADKIRKLEEMTVERGASEQEEETAKNMILRLKEKALEQSDKASKYTVIGMIPGHMANPPRCNWHIEKDGVYVAKGNGILKYAKVDSYYRGYLQYDEDLNNFRTMSKEEYIKKEAEELTRRGYYEKDKAKSIAESRYKNMIDSAKLIDQFEDFIKKLDLACGGLLGEGDGVIYEKVTVTEYKKEIKPFEVENGSIKEGQCFKLKVNFNYGCYKGLVYRIHERECKGEKSYYAYKLNGKHTKECTGNANRNNYWYIGTSDSYKFMEWVNEGAIAWCELREVKTPYEVEKVVKKNISSNKKEPTENGNAKSSNVNASEYSYEITEDVDTRDNSQIWLVRIQEKLDRNEYIEANKYMKSLGGYYSKFKNAFLFKENPAELLNGRVEVKERKQEQNTKIKQETEQKKIQYIITEDVHTKTGKQIWVVTFSDRLSKDEFAEEKRKLATLNGFYSGFKSGFIFDYNPTDKLQIA